MVPARRGHLRRQAQKPKDRIAQLALRLDRVGEIEEAAGVYAETKIEELAERKLQFDKPEQSQEAVHVARRCMVYGAPTGAATK